MRRRLLDTIACVLAASLVTVATGQERPPQLDARVQAFLKSQALMSHSSVKETNISLPSR
jgi:hypothetical protein